MLRPVIGYDRAAEIAYSAIENNLTLEEAAIKSGYIDRESFRQLVNPQTMAGINH